MHLTIFEDVKKLLLITKIFLILLITKDYGKNIKLDRFLPFSELCQELELL